jgi:hypothetical protein
MAGDLLGGYGTARVALPGSDQNRLNKETLCGVLR